MTDDPFTSLGLHPASLSPAASRSTTTSDAGLTPSVSDAPLTARSSARHAKGGTRRPRSDGSPAMLEASRRHAVLGPCPKFGRATRTHAVMNARELSRFKGELVYWCDHCRAAHRASWPHLQLSGAEPPVAAAHESAQIDASPA